MKQHTGQWHLCQTYQRAAHWILLVLALGFALATYQMTASAVEFDGFTEPRRSVDVAAVETGTIKTIEVREGQQVEEGDVLARLDDEEYVALLAIAKEAMQAKGQLQSVEAEAELRRQRLRKLVALREQGHARQEEVDRAEADLAIANARVLAAEESLRVKKLEHRKIEVKIDRRIVRSPITGVINLVHKDKGEFVAPNDPYILELVQLDPLIATFSVPSNEGARLRSGAKVPVYLNGRDAQESVEGTIDFVSPVTDAESGTVRVKVRIANGDGRYRSGEPCILRLDNPRRKSSRHVSK